MTNPEEPRPERQFSARDYPHGELTWKINGAFFQVHHDLGFGHLESAYRKAMAVELEYCGIAVAREVPFELFHRGVSVGFYRADLIADSSVIIEVKTGPALDPTAMAQLCNYLKVSGLRVGLILHFGPKAKVKRLIASGASR